MSGAEDNDAAAQPVQPGAEAHPPAQPQAVRYVGAGAVSPPVFDWE